MAGGLATSSVLFIASGLLAPVNERLLGSLVAIFALAATMRDFRLIPLPLPAVRRQVPQEIFAKRPLVYSLQFGFELGTGVRTQAPAAAAYIPAVALLLLSPDFVFALAAGLGFGLGRSAMPALRYASPSPTNWDTQLRRVSRPIIRGCSILISASAIWLAFP